MIKLLKMTVYSFILTVFSYSAANAALTATGDADAEVVSPLSITGGDGGAGGASLNFGIFDNAVAGDVIVTPAGGLTTPSGMEHFGSEEAAGFTVAGNPSDTYSVTLPSNGVVTLTGPGSPMAVKDFAHNSGGTLSGSGSDTFNVGATLEVAAGQTIGSYTGTYDVTIAY